MKSYEEIFTPFSELCKFADQYSYRVEIEKPFQQFDQLYLKVVNEDGETVERITLEDISTINVESASLLNRLGKEN